MTPSLPGPRASVEELREAVSELRKCAENESLCYVRGDLIGTRNAAREADEHQAALNAALSDLASLRSELQRKTRALEAINACIHWNDTYQTWVLLGRDRAQPALELVRAALNPTDKEKQT